MRPGPVAGSAAARTKRSRAKLARPVHASPVRTVGDPRWVAKRLRGLLRKTALLDDSGEWLRAELHRLACELEAV